ncbi:MAG: hypothetical protein ACTHKK_02860 [Candidatus Nitrosocosmicus sp.]
MSNNNNNNTFQSESFLSYGSFLLVGKGASLGTDYSCNSDELIIKKTFAPTC